jgi:Protein of unknown function (DUF1778)
VSDEPGHQVRRETAVQIEQGARIRITPITLRDTLALMKTLRLDPELEKRLHRAASVTGVSLSEFIRQAAAQRADVVLSADPREDFADVLGAIHGGGGHARRSGQAFSELLAARRTPR